MMKNVSNTFAAAHRAIPLALAFATIVSCQPDQRSVTELPRMPAPRAAVAATSTTTLNPTADTYLNINSTNYSTNDSLHLYTWPDNAIANAILMKFDLSSIPPGSTISSATLNLYLIDSDPSSDPTYTVTVHKIINKNPDLSGATGYTYDGVNGWTPNGCCFNGIPLAQADIGPAADTKSIDKTFGYKQWNVTSIIQEWFANSGTNFGLLVNSDPSKLRDRWRSFGSSQNPTVGVRPFLTVIYTPPGAVDWPNRPIDFDTITDWGFDGPGAIPTSGDVPIPGSPGWRVANNSPPGNTEGWAQLSSDAAAPRSPSTILQFVYPSGYHDGHSPANIYWPGQPAVNEIYVGFWWKMSNPWQFHPVLQKLGYLIPTSGSPIPDLYLAVHSSDRLLYVDMQTGTSGNLVPNVPNPTIVTLGEWHQVELYAQYVPGQWGHLKWWLDGQLQGDYTGPPPAFPNTTGIPAPFTNGWEFAPVFGGSDGTQKTETDYFWYDHVHIAGR